MKFGKLVSAAVLLGAVAACGETGGSLKAQPGQDANEIARSIVQTRAIAQVVGTSCQSRGIALRQPNMTIALTADINNLKKQGYSDAELTAAFRRTTNDKRLINSAISYLTSRGAKKGNIASVCAVGSQEITKQTAVGKLLKRI